ncbi:aldo/keto reductase [soil metagenome]
MLIQTKKLSNNFELPVFGLGTWTMGGRLEHDIHNDDQRNISAIKNAIEAGITHIDTAEKYAAGYAETLVGKAIRGYDRKDLFLVTKIAEEHLHYNDVETSLHHSLERLQIDYIDMYMVHGPSPTIPIEETMEALDDLVDKGFIKNLALSNFTVERFEKAQRASKHKIVAGQYHFNLKYREPERKNILDYCQSHDVMFIAWRPIQKGIIAMTNSPLLKQLCKKYTKTPTQIAINWLISQKNVVTLSKMSTQEHLEENLGALGWSLEKEDVQKLTTEFPDQQNISDAVPLID